MRLQAFLLVSAAVVFSAEWRAVESYVSTGEVPVKDGKCQYNDTEITPGEPLRVEYPCEMWTCGVGDGVTGNLDIAGCGVVRAGPGCRTVRGTGVYPDCCQRSLCTN
uniref:8.9 kDa family member n=1 Tax=Rhipicephalus appendiculatus TaxID=34631 RepID=A0A131YH06_RHIAP